MFMFGWDFEVDTCSWFWRWNLIQICVRICDMNSTLGSVVPLAMFWVLVITPVFFMKYKFKYQSSQRSVSVSVHPPTPFPPKGRAANARMGGGGGSIQISTHGIGPGSNGDPRMQMLKPPIGNSKISWNRCSVSVKLIHLSLSILRYLISISY